MINDMPDSPTFNVALTLEAHSQAAHLQRHCTDRNQAKQVYLNTLAIYAVKFYVELLGFQTNLQASHSWNCVQQILLNPADLPVRDCGVLECCPILPGATTLHVPPERWNERIGFVAVQLSASLKEATLLGFLKAIDTEEVSLDQLLLLEQLPLYLHQLQTNYAKQPVSIGEWLHHAVNSGWQAVGEFFTPHSVPQFAASFRTLSTSTVRADEQVAGSKILNLKDDSGDIQIRLLLGIFPLKGHEVEIWVQVSPEIEQQHLPHELELMILDEEGLEVMRAQARSTEAIQLQFTGMKGEHFSLKLVLNHDAFVEQFVI